MEARLHHYSGLRLLQMQTPAASPMTGLASAGAVPDDADAAECDYTMLTILAFLVCALVAALALHAVLQCALRVTRRRAYYDNEGQQQQHAGGNDASSFRHWSSGNSSKKKKPRRSALVQALPCLAYFAGLDLAGSSRSECAICLAEFARGDRVRVLPRCNHGFHARCIDRWLIAARPTCPTCRQSPFADEHQPAGLALQPDTDRPAGAVQLVRVVVVSDGVSRHVEEEP